MRLALVGLTSSLRTPAQTLASKATRSVALSVSALYVYTILVNFISIFCTMGFLKPRVFIYLSHSRRAASIISFVAVGKPLSP